MATPRRIKASELSAVKKELLKKQKFKCPICAGSLIGANTVVDHDHETGIIRAVLHRGCNGAEGKLKRLMILWGKCSPSTIADGLKRMIAYWELHKTAQTEYIYHTFRTEAEKKVAKKRKK